MSKFGRRNMSPEDRLEQRQIEDSLKVSSYLDDVYEAIHTNTMPKVDVPNYKEPSLAELRKLESEGVSMDFEGLYAGVARDLSPEQMKTAMADTHAPRESDEKTFSHASSPPSSQPGLPVSRSQAMALKKYPTLIEFLGRPEGEKIAKRIAGDMNLLIADMVAANSKEANVHAIACKAEKQNLKQYFQGEGWLCRVTASGPFRGDEAIYYHREKDAACILRRAEVDGQVRYSDISTNFNIIYEAEEGPASPLPVEEPVVEASVDETTSTAEQGENDVIKAEAVVSTAIEEGGSEN